MHNIASVETPAASELRTDPLWYAQGDSWALEQVCWDIERSTYFETIFSIANGYMGFRGYREEVDDEGPACREGYLAGLFGKLSPEGRKLVIHDYPWDSLQMVSLPELFSVQVNLDGEMLALDQGELLEYRQCLNLRNALLEREVLWRSPTGKVTRLRFSRFLSIANVNLVAHRIEINPVDWIGEISVCWQYEVAATTRLRCGDPDKPHLPCQHFSLKESLAEGNMVSALLKTDGAGHDVAIISAVLSSDTVSHMDEGGALSQTVSESVSPNSPVVFERFTAIATTRDEGVTDPASHARSQLLQAVQAGFQSELADHSILWKQRWEDADIEIDGPARDQVLVRFGIFSLLQMAPFHADNLSTPARCYSYNRYNGLYFWDGEIFLVPFYQFCAPQVARNMLKFRCLTLPGARENAKLVGGSGAAFPWQGDADYGREQAPWGLYEYLWHQTADIVYAFDQYARATGDVGFMYAEGLEVLVETARFWASKFEMGEDGKYHLHGTVGPDEAEDHGADNGYTCLMARRNLDISCHWLESARIAQPQITAVIMESLGLNQSEVDTWKGIASKVNIPEVPDCPGVPLQDAFLLKKKPVDVASMTVAEYWQVRGEARVIKQADIVLAMYLLEDSFTIEEIKRGYEFYEPLTLHVSSLSYNTHAIVASLIGQESEAYTYFLKAAGLDLDNLRNATKDGLHAAALGAVWQMVLPGFMGLRAREDYLLLNPRLPKAWRSIRFPIHYREWHLQVEASAESIRIRVDGQGLCGARLHIGDKHYELHPGLTIMDSIRV